MFQSNKIILSKLLFAIFIFCLSSDFKIFAQSSVDTLAITRDTKFPLQISTDKLIIGNSFLIIKPNMTNRVIFSYEKSEIIIEDFQQYFVIHPDDTVKVIYRSFPFIVQPVYKKYSLTKSNDSGGVSTSIVENNEIKTSVDDIFRDTNLRKSGSFVRGITVGSNRDLTLNSGFRMQMDGNLTDDVEVSAVLTDENIPIQPEGNTQTLSELDKVFVQLRSEHYRLTLGDYNLTIDGTRYSNYSRKLQGIELATSYDKFGGYVSFANSKGKYFSNTFNGIDGNQGPYRLRGKNNEKFIIVLAGSERVYHNGILLTRGESNDYIIDYSSGEITFTQKILITAASRITADYEYSDRLFARDFISSGFNGSILSNSLTTKISFVREADNKNAPIDFILSDSDKLSLKSAGNQPEKAIRSGIDSVGVDKVTGKTLGSYSKRDTTIGGINQSYYNYEPGGSKSFYRVSFSEVGSNAGSYSKKTIGYYEFVGSGKGNYEPIIFLPVPTSSQVYDMKTNYNFSKNLTFQNEWAISTKNSNLFAEISESEVHDFASINSIRYVTDSILVRGNNYGIFESSLTFDYQGQNFSFIDRNQDVNYNRDWSIEESESAIRRQLNLTTEYKYVEPLTVTYNYGILNEGTKQDASKHVFSVFENFENWVNGNYRLIESKSNNSVTATNSQWSEHFGNLNYKLGQFTPFISGLYEKKIYSSNLNDSLQSPSFRGIETESGINQSNSQFASGLKYKVRTEDGINGGKFYQSNQAFTESSFFQLNEWNSLTTNFNLTRYNKKYSERARKLGNSNTEALLVKWETNYSPMRRSLSIETDYSVNTQKTSRYDRIFIKVQRGYGNYIWIDRNENGLEENDEFEPTRFDNGEYVLRTFPSEELIPIIDLRASLRFKLKPNRSDNFSFLHDFVKQKLSTETFISIDEKSKSTNLTDIYFLNLSQFLNDSTTINGSQQFIQDLFYDESNRNFNMRIRFQQRRSVVQYSLDIERRLVLDRSIRAVIKLSDNIFSQTDLGIGESKFTTNSKFRPSYIIKNTYVIPDLSYRSGYTWEVGLKTLLDYRVNSLSENQSAIIWSEIVRYNYSFQGKGRFRAEFELTNTTIKSGINEVLSYELSNGNPAGKLYVWRTIFDYKLSDFITSYFSYDGRLANSNPAIHTMRAEIRAFF